MNKPETSSRVSQTPSQAAEPVLTTKKAPPFVITHPVRKERWLNMAVYGEYGVGKTTFAATADDAPSMRDILYIDAESGDLTLQERPHLDVIRIDRYSQMARIHEFLRIHCQARDENNEEKLLELDTKLRPEGEEPKIRRYKTVIIDSLSEVFKYCMYNLTGVQIGKAILDVEPEQPGFTEWGKSTEMIRLLVRTFRDLPMNVVFVLSEKSLDDKNKKASIQLNMPKALAAELPGFLDVVGYLDVATVGGDKSNPIKERRLYLQPGHGFLAKNRFTSFKDDYMVNPSMPKLAAMVKGG